MRFISITFIYNFFFLRLLSAFQKKLFAYIFDQTLADYIIKYVTFFLSKLS